MTPHLVAAKLRDMLIDCWPNTWPSAERHQQIERGLVEHEMMDLLKIEEA